MSPRSFAAIAAALLAALVLGGCVNETVTQNAPGGPVHVVATICDSTNQAGTASFHPCDIGWSFTDEQIVVAWVVPDGTGAPSSISFTGDGGGTLTENASAETALGGSGLAPASGSHWVAYASDAAITGT